MSDLTFSIVVPSLNQGRYLAEALQSIAAQRHSRLELLVLDGGSTDETGDVLARFADVITYAVSEPDSGQAAALNKGFRQTTGDILAWLNADDLYLPGTFARVAAVLTDPRERALVYGGCLHFRQVGRKAWGYRPEPFDADRLTYDDFIVQPSTFWTRALWEATGELDERLCYGLDWDWYIRASRVGRFIPIEDYLAIYRVHGDQKTETGGQARGRELVEIVERYGDAAWGAAFRATCERLPALKRDLQRLRQRGLYRMRALAYPALYLRHGQHRIDTAVTMLAG